MGSGDDRRERAAEAIAELVGIIDRLRSPGGCPWDREQTSASLKPFIIEEAYEVVDAIDGGRPDDLREELGDLLLQILLQSQIAFEERGFDIVDVIRGLSTKMVTRHPHVFGDVSVEGSDQVLVNWEKIKKKEKVDVGLFDGLPADLPGLQRAARMGEKAGRVGFDWAEARDVRAKVGEELRELDEAVRIGLHDDVQHELGDLLFAVAQWARHLGHAPEEALRLGCKRFAMRFALLEKYMKTNGREISDCEIDELEAAWQEIKKV